MAESAGSDMVLSWLKFAIENPAFQPLVLTIFPFAVAYLFSRAIAGTIAELEKKGLYLLPASRLKNKLAFVQTSLGKDKFLEPTVQRILQVEEQALIAELTIGFRVKSDEMALLKAIYDVTPSRYDWKFMKYASRFIHQDAAKGISLSKTVKFSFIAKVFFALVLFASTIIIGSFDLQQVQGNKALALALVFGLQLTIYLLFTLLCISAARDADLLDIEKRYFAKASELFQETLKQSKTFDSARLPEQSQDLELKKFGISEIQAQEIRGRLASFADAWDSPDMDVYNDLRK